MSNEPTMEMMNEAIAVFDGYRIYDEGLTRCVVDKVFQHAIPVANLRYHLSWDWLMVVVRKIGRASCRERVSDIV
jgi:hypothetical protein